MNITALIPARANSKRISGKNIKDFMGAPLIAYTIKTALDSRLFDRVVVSTDSDEIGKIAARYGAEWIKRPDEFARDCSPDIEWLNHAREILDDYWSDIAILRPTNPFRTVEMLRKASQQFDDSCATSMRAIEKVKQHPHKMWELHKQDGFKWILPLMADNSNFMQEDFTLPTQSLPECYIQNGSLEIRRYKHRGEINVCGDNIMPYLTKGYEGFDINDELDWILAEELVNRGMVKLPEVK